MQRFAQKVSLNGHIASVHEEKRPYKCHICDAIFAYKPNLNGHILSVREEKKPFKCETCNAIL